MSAITAIVTSPLFIAVMMSSRIASIVVVVE